MLSKILVAIDGSLSSKKAFEKALFISQKCGSKLDVIHVVPCEFGGDSALTFELMAALKSKAEQILNECKIQASKAGVVVGLMVHQGDPAQSIISLANKNGYDLIVMGTRGRTPFRELLLGSVSLKVIHHAVCPVMVVR